MNRYPIFIISKGRWEARKTARALLALKIPFKIVVEPQEADQYIAVLGDHVHVAPENFSERGQGGIPVRNYVWQLAEEIGSGRHWIMDDNISRFCRLNRNYKTEIDSGDGWLRAMEDFVDRYENVGMAGPNYYRFAPPHSEMPPYYFNTRIYSCILIRNDLDQLIGGERWRGKFNEDTDLSLRTLKAGQCTFLFNAFLADKGNTSGGGKAGDKGGNEAIYGGASGDRIEFVESLMEQHPDVVTITKKFGRWHHQVDYSRFDHDVIYREGVLSDLEPGRVRTYEMVFRDFGPDHLGPRQKAKLEEKNGS